MWRRLLGWLMGAPSAGVRVSLLRALPLDEPESFDAMLVQVSDGWITIETALAQYRYRVSDVGCLTCEPGVVWSGREAVTEADG